MLNKGSARQVQSHGSRLLAVTANVSLTAKRELGYSYGGDIQGEEIIVDSEHAEIILAGSSGKEGRQQTRALPNLLPPLWGVGIFFVSGPGVAAPSSL